MWRKKELTEQDEKMLKLVRALANAMGVLLFFLFLIQAVQKGGLDALIQLNGQDTITFVCVLVMFFGMIWASQKALAGGVLILVTYLVLSINLGTPVPDAATPVFFLVGLLYLFIGLRA